MDNSLAREYLIDTQTWTTSQASGTLIAKYDFPNVLFAENYIAAKIADFAKFKAGIRFSFRIISNKFLYGKLILYYHPNKNFLPSAAALDTDQMIASGLPHCLGSASSGDAVTLDASFTSQFRFLDINSFTAGEMGTFYLMVFNPLTDVMGQVSTAQILITAQFLEPKMFYPITLTSKSDDFEAAFARKVTTQSSSDFRYPGSPTSSGKKLISVASMRSQASLQAKRPQEAAKKASSGTISDTLESLSDVSAALSCVPLVTPYAGLFSMAAKAGANIARVEGLDKPTTLAVTDVIKVNAYADINYGKGVDLGGKIAFDPENRITSKPIVGGITADEMAFDHFAGTPQCVNQVTLTKAAVGTTPIVISQLNSDELCYADQLSHFFQWFSCTYKYKLYIEASLYHSVRLVFWINRGNTTTEWVNCYHRVLDVQGNTELELSIPYLSKLVMRPNETGIINVLNCTILSWSQPVDAVAAPIYLNLYKAASNYQVGQLKDTRVVVTTSAQSEFDQIFLQSNPRADFAKDFEFLHPSMTGYQNDGVICGEQFKSLRDMVHMMTPYALAGGAGAAWPIHATYDVDPTTIAGQKIYLGFEQLSQFFVFWRGSIRMKLILRNVSTSNNGALIFKRNTGQILHGASVSTLVNPVLEAEVPYYYNTLMLPTQTNGNDVIQYEFDNMANFRYLWKSAGDDYSLHFMCPPLRGFAIQDQYTGSTTGYEGFVTFIG